MSFKDYLENENLFEMAVIGERDHDLKNIKMNLCQVADSTKQHKHGARLKVYKSGIDNDYFTIIINK